MPQEIVTTYEFLFEDGQRLAIPVRLRLPGYDLVADAPAAPLPHWTKLGFEQCPNCTLNGTCSRCQAAVNLIPLGTYFSDRRSTEIVDVNVYTAERTYVKKCPLQHGVSSLMGLIMATSGCPHLDKLRPMVLTHLPFSSAEQTMFRTISMYLLAQFLRQRRGMTTDWQLNELTRTYDEIKIVNQAFARRLRSCQTRDANLNAIVNLDCQADLASFSIAEEQWEELDHLFQPYLQNAGTPIAAE